MLLQQRLMELPILLRAVVLVPVVEQQQDPPEDQVEVAPDALQQQEAQLINLQSLISLHMQMSVKLERNLNMAVVVAALVGEAIQEMVAMELSSGELHLPLVAPVGKVAPVEALAARKLVDQRLLLQIAKRIQEVREQLALDQAVEEEMMVALVAS
jgi:hypothetical protein